MFLEFEDFLFNCESKGLSVQTIKGYRNCSALLLKHRKFLEMKRTTFYKLVKQYEQD